MMTMKRSISLTDTTDETLANLSASTGFTPSDVTEAALLHFATLNAVDLKRSVAQVVDAKRVSTLAGWRGLFLRQLAETLGFQNFVYDSRRVFAPYQFNGCQVVFLLPNIRGAEDGTLAVHIMESVRLDIKPYRQPENATLFYTLEDSVARAVGEAAAWINTHGDARGD